MQGEEHKEDRVYKNGKKKKDAIRHPYYDPARCYVQRPCLQLQGDGKVQGRCWLADFPQTLVARSASM